MINDEIKIYYTNNNIYLNLLGIFKFLEQLLNILILFSNLEIFHLNIFGKDFNEEHPLNIDSILMTFIVFQLDISGNDINEEHP